LRVTTSAGKVVVGDEPLALAAEVRCELVDAPPGPWRQWGVVQRADRCTRCCPRRRRHGRRLAEVAKSPPWESGEREDGWLPPQDLRGRDRHHRHHLDVRARLITVDLQKHRRR
jgi:hypothetical protein